MRLIQWYGSDVTYGYALMNSVDSTNASDSRPDSASDNASVGGIVIEDCYKVICRNVPNLSYQEMHIPLKHEEKYSTRACSSAESDRCVGYDIGGRTRCAFCVPPSSQL